MLSDECHAATLEWRIIPDEMDKLLCDVQHRKQFGCILKYSAEE